MLSPNIVKGQSDGAVISISATAYAPLMIGHGITIHIANIESGQVFISKSLHGISNNSVIENVPAGKYAVTFAEIPFGNIKWRNRSPELQDFFGIIQVDSGESYRRNSLSISISIIFRQKISNAWNRQVNHLYLHMLHYKSVVASF